MILGELGLTQLSGISNDPRQLFEQLQTDDARDGATDGDEFSRGIRRAVRLQLAFAAKLHRRAGTTWKAWVGEHFQAGYICYRRYHAAAELQTGLIFRGLPRLSHGSQARALAPLRRHARFWDALFDSAFQPALPSAPALRGRMEALLNVTPRSADTPRLRLHRQLRRLLARTHPGDDPAVHAALEALARAATILEQGHR